MPIIPLEHWRAIGIDVRSHSTSTARPIDDLLRDSEERVALDLHVGDSYQVDFNGWVAMPQELVLRPNDCVRIRVDESITTPTTVFGQVCSKSAPSADGLLVANQKVDPNFSGRLELAVFNAGRISVRISQGLVFASLWFANVEPPISDAPRRLPTQTQGIAKRDIRETWRAARPYVLTGLASATSAVIAGILLKLV